jgi:hypothetical protein
LCFLNDISNGINNGITAKKCQSKEIEKDLFFQISTKQDLKGTRERRENNDGYGSGRDHLRLEVQGKPAGSQDGSPPDSAKSAKESGAETDQLDTGYFRGVQL